MCLFKDLIDHAQRTGVKIINMSMGLYSRDDWICFYDGAKEHPHILFVVSAGNDGFDIDSNPVFPASLDLENMVVVTSFDQFGRLPTQSNYGRGSVDLMVPAEKSMFLIIEASTPPLVARVTLHQEWLPWPQDT